MASLMFGLARSALLRGRGQPMVTSYVQLVRQSLVNSWKFPRSTPHSQNHGLACSQRLSSSTTKKVTIRRAQLSDFDAVMALGRGYEGDHLWSLYGSLLADPDSYAIVATLEENVVGFIMTSSFDAGQTVCMRSGRVELGLRGLGISRVMQAELERHTREERPNAVYETTANTNTEDKFAERFKRAGYRDVVRKEALQMLYQSNKVRPRETKTKTPLKHVQVMNLTEQDLKLLFHSERASPTLFQNGRLLNFYLSYRLMEENTKHILCERGGVFFSLADEPHHTFQPFLPDHGLEFKPASRPELKQNRELGEPHETEHTHTTERFQQISKRYLSDQNSSSFSRFVRHLDPKSVQRVAMATFYYCFPTPSGFMYYLDVYAREGVSRDHFSAHLGRNLDVLQNNFPNQDGCLAVSFDSAIPRDHVTSCLMDVGIRELRPYQEEWHVLYERRVDSWPGMEV